MTRRRPPIHAKKDANHNEIVRHFKALGWSVIDLSNVGGGVSDLVVGGVHPVHGRINVFVEVKTKRGRLRENQQALIATWRGRPIEVARDLNDVLRITGQHTER